MHGAGECKLLRKGELRDAFTQRWRHHRRLDNYAMLLEEEGLIIDENQEPKESELEFRKAAGDSARFIRCKREDGQEFLWTD